MLRARNQALVIINLGGAACVMDQRADLPPASHRLVSTVDTRDCCLQKFSNIEICLHRQGIGHGLAMPPSKNLHVPVSDSGYTPDH